VELYERHPALETLEKIDPRGAANLKGWLVTHRESEVLRDRARPALEAIIAQAPQAITMHRTAQSREVWLRFQGLPFARWEDVTRVDAALDQRFVYAQVFANAGGEHGILDLLTITRAGRLAIIELKASEHIHLPLQAADYWLRVRRHLENGEITRYGYFPAVELQQAPPLIYLVAPALRFHPSTDELLKYLSPELEIVRVGLAESWRRGLRVVMRQ
jgi:hypothetical protein